MSTLLLMVVIVALGFALVMQQIRTFRLKALADQLEAANREVQ